jgi:GTPase SAR1 family protein
MAITNKNIIQIGLNNFYAEINVNIDISIYVNLGFRRNGEIGSGRVYINGESAGLEQFGKVMSNCARRIIFMGAPRTGKTHLIHHIIKHCLSDMGLSQESNLTVNAELEFNHSNNKVLQILRDSKPRPGQQTDTTGIHVFTLAMKVNDNLVDFLLIDCQGVDEYHKKLMNIFAVNIPWHYVRSKAKRDFIASKFRIKEFPYFSKIYLLLCADGLQCHDNTSILSYKYYEKTCRTPRSATKLIINYRDLEEKDRINEQIEDLIDVMSDRCDGRLEVGNVVSPVDLQNVITDIQENIMSDRRYLLINDRILH